MLGIKNTSKTIGLDMLEEPAFLFGRRGEFLNCNDAAKDFLCDMGHDDHYHPPKIEIFLSLLKTRFDINHKNIFDHENWRFSVMIKKSIHGALLRLMPVIVDSKQKTDKEIDCQAHRMEALGHLACGISHDVNNILSIVDGYCKMAKKSLPPDCVEAGYMDHISKAVERGVALTGRLLTFGRHKMHHEKTIDLGQIIKDQKPLISALMGASIELSITADKDIYVDVSPDNLCHILLNLCINARDAMTKGGCLNISIKKIDRFHAAIEVKDTGCGMSEDVRQRIFNPFFTTKDGGVGTGLGLSMAYSFVKDMNGMIDVVSTEGVGTTIRIVLPISKKLPHDDSKTHLCQNDISLTGVTAMVVEDEPELLEIVSNMMEEIGVRVIRACNGDEALLLQEEYEGKIDFLLTDVAMPELNGIRLAELFSACRPDSKIMFMSGCPVSGKMTRVSIPDGAYLMSKPINSRDLTAVIRNLLMAENDSFMPDTKKIKGEWKITQ